MKKGLLNLVNKVLLGGVQVLDDVSELEDVKAAIKRYAVEVAT